MRWRTSFDAGRLSSAISCEDSVKTNFYRFRATFHFPRDVTPSAPLSRTGSPSAEIGPLLLTYFFSEGT